MAQKKKQKPKHKHHRGGGVPKLPGLTLSDMMALKAQLVEDVKEDARSETSRILADRQAQRMKWIITDALNRRYQFGPKRFEELDATIEEVIADYKQDMADNDQEYADEKLRQRVSQIRKGDVNYLYEDLYPVNADLSDEAFATLRESEQRIR